MKFPVIVLIVLTIALLAVPVNAFNYVVTGAGVLDFSKSINQESVSSFSYQADADESISLIEFDMPINTVVNFTLNYGEGSTTTGYCVYESYWVFGRSTSKVKLGADENTYSETFIDAQAAGISLVKHVQFSSYARNTTDANNEQSGFALYAPGYGLVSNEIVFYPVTNLPNNLVNGITMTATQPIAFHLNTAKTGALGKIAAKTIFQQMGDGWQTILDIGSSVKDIGLSAFYWLKFIFVDNIILTFALYIGVTMAYSAITSNGIWAFYKKFFRLQKIMIEFMLSTVGTIVTMLRNLIPV